MQNRFSLSFTAASLRPELMRIAAEIFLASDGWEAAKVRTLCTNALQCRTTGSAKRLERELRHRLQRLTRPQLSLLAQAPAEDRAAMAWLAVCKQTGFAFEFAAGVLREKLTSHDPVLRPSDYESYIELQAVSHPELDALTPTSKAKIRQVLFRMLGESGLLSPGVGAKQIHRPVLSPPAFDVSLHAFLAHFEDAFLIRTTSLLTASERQRMVNPRKAYPIDPGLIPIYERVGRDNLGHSLETAVLIELLRRGCEVHYFRTPLWMN